MVVNLKSAKSEDLFILTSLDLEILDASKALCGLFCYDKKSIKGKNARLFFAKTSADGLTEIIDQIASLRKQMIIETKTFSRKNDEFTSEIVISPIFLFDGSINRLLFTFIENIPKISQKKESDITSDIADHIFQEKFAQHFQENSFQDNGSLRKRKFSDIRDVLLLCLYSKDKTVNEIATESKANWKTVNSHLNHLAGKGLVKEVLKLEYVRIYGITPSGKVAALEILKTKQKIQSPKNLVLHERMIL